MIVDFREMDVGLFPYVLIDGEGELISDRVQTIHLTTGKGTRVPEKIAIDRNGNLVTEPVEYVPPLTLVDGTGWVVAQGDEIVGLIPLSPPPPYAEPTLIHR